MFGHSGRYNQLRSLINIIPNIDGLLHISKIADKRIDNVEDYLKLGDKIQVRVSNV
ncbi:MAG: S1 RNA-binding domain-containing protein [Actinomycetota bacterium]|nr:S1 RNA-binding domain-containing protein [Actinomycetota bacterium]